MFGFTPIATTPLAASQAGVSARIVIGSVFATASATPIRAHITELLSSVAATSQVGTLVLNPDEVVNSVSATVSVNAVKVNLSEVLAGVSATGSVSTVGYEAKANHTLASVLGTTTVEPVSAGGFEVDISEPLLSVQAVAYAGSVTVNISEALEGVSATVSLTAVQPHVNAQQELEGVSATTTVQSLAVDLFEIDVSEGLLSVVATATVNPVIVNITERLNTVGANANVSGVTVVAINFPFDKDAYSTHRIVYTTPQPKDIVVHISADNRVVVITDKDTTSNTIQIAA